MQVSRRDVSIILVIVFRIQFLFGRLKNIAEIVLVSQRYSAEWNAVAEDEAHASCKSKCLPRTELSIQDLFSVI